MQTNNFILHLTKPDSILTLTESGVNSLVNQFPFCQTGQTLNTIYLNNNNSLLFEEQLKKTAIYSSDRKRLFDHLKPQTKNIEEQKEVTKEISVLEIGKEEAVSPTQNETKAIEKEIDPLEKNYISAAVSSSYLLEAEEVIPEKEAEKEEVEIDKPIFDENEPHSFKEWLSHLKGEHIIEEKSTRKKINLDVIDKFIQEDPQIKPKRSEFYSPINMARLSVVDDSDMVSETLALIYVEQGNYNNAISTYEKLSLKNPEKRSYFANQIKILKQKIK